MVYLAEIEEIFSKVRGFGIVLSPLNWIIAEKWEQMGIPLSIISKGIKKSCRRFRNEERRVDVLTYCEPRIFALWKEYKQKTIGFPRTGSKNEEYEQTFHLVLKKIKDIRKDLDLLKTGEHQWAEIILFALVKVEYGKLLGQIEEKVQEDFLRDTIVDIEKTETMLSELDHKIVEMILNSLPDELKKNFLDEINQKLEGYREHMERAVYEESLTISLKNLIRERFMLKRISLYAA